MIPQRGRAPQAPAPFMGGGRRPPLISVGSCPGCQGVRSFGFLLCLFLYIIRPQWSRSEVLCPFGLPRVSRSEGFLYLFLYFSCTFSRPWSCTRFCIFPVFSGSRGFIEPSSPEKTSPLVLEHTGLSWEVRGLSWDVSGPDLGRPGTVLGRTRTALGCPVTALEPPKTSKTRPNIQN